MILNENISNDEKLSDEELMNTKIDKYISKKFKNIDEFVEKKVHELEQSLKQYHLEYNTINGKIKSLEQKHTEFDESCKQRMNRLDIDFDEFSKTMYWEIQNHTTKIDELKAIYDNTYENLMIKMKITETTQENSCSVSS